MNRSFRPRTAIAVGLVSAVALLGVVGCARADRSAAPPAEGPAETSDLGWEAQALQSIGLDGSDLAAANLAPAPLAAPAGSPSPAASASPGRADRAERRHRLVRYAFGRSALHGEAVVQTDDGTKTVVVQRGAVTAVDATSITVKSTDGFTLTWTFGTPITVIERRSQVAPSAIAVGAQVGVAGEKSAGEKSAGGPSARLIVVPNRKS